MKITRLIEKCPIKYDFGDIQPFVFQSDDGEPEVANDLPKGTILATPFEIFSIEMDDCFLAAVPPGDELGIYTMYCKELGPGSYDILALMTYYDNGELEEGVTHVNSVNGTEDNCYDFYLTVLNHMLTLLHSRDCGTISGDGRAKYKTPSGEKKFFKPKNVIYIGDKKRTVTNGSVKKIINWSTQFSTMGHWRRINPDSMGKNRQGERVVKGLTWVNEHIKGTGPLTTKVRKLKI